MAFIDEMSIRGKAGDGGKGVVRWIHEKGKEFGGPGGGNGGAGGNIYVRAVRDNMVLASYRHTPEFRAENGTNGGSWTMDGKAGEDLYVKVPVGALVTNKNTGEVFEMNEEGQTTMILKGGRGGYGNFEFRSSTNQQPEESTPGTKGESAEFYIELRITADVGLIGLPNAGKSSLLNALTRAVAKIGSYAFTTLEPNLGSFYGYVIADIPGLIEGASEGKGLGHKFLRHVRRTHLLAHLVSLENEDPLAAYQVVRKELVMYHPELAAKQEIIVLTKTDMVDESVVKATKKKFAKTHDHIFAISVIDDVTMKEFGDELIKLVRANKPQADDTE